MPKPGSTPVGTLPHNRQCPTCLELFPEDFKVCPRDAVELVEVARGEDEDPLVGAVLNDCYQIIRQVGEGGMGRVYEARHVRLMNRTYAIKVMHEFHARQYEIVERFRREAETTCAIGHENVVEVYDVDSTPDGIPYIVCEFLQGEDLGAILEREKTLDEAISARIMRQICRALEAAHQHGIVHRDLKPENVYVVGGLEDPRVKLLDFGIARVEDPAKAMHTRTGLIMGTPAFMAPEQAQGSKVDHRADIYSVGAILYRMLTGVCAHDREDPAQTLSALLTEEPIRPCDLAPHLSAAFELVIQRAMARSPAERYQSMAELEAELAAFDVPADATAEKSITSPALAAGHATPLVDDTATRLVGSRSLVARASRQSKTARPWIALSLLLLMVWGYGTLVRTIVCVVELVTGSAIGATELSIVAVGVAVAMLTPAILWIRNIGRTIWRNSVLSMVLARRLRAFVAVALATLGLATVVVGVVGRFVSLEPRMTVIDLVVAGLSALGGLVAYFLTPKEA